MEDQIRQIQHKLDNCKKEGKKTYFKHLKGGKRNTKACPLCSRIPPAAEAKFTPLMMSLPTAKGIA